MACSLLAAAALCGAAAAQSEPRPVAAAVYNARIAPWPAPKPQQTAPLPVSVMPPTEALPSRPPNLPPAPPVRTLYYQKDANTAGLPPAAALRPAAAQEPKPMAPAAPPVNAQTPAAKPADAKPADAKLPDPEGVPPERLLRLDSEAAMIERTNAERAEENKRIPEAQKDKRKSILEMPTQPPLSAERYPGRAFARSATFVEPNYVMYKRLLFEERNAERYGWSFGPLQPFLSTAKFVGDVTNLPNKVFSFPCIKFDSSAGLCQPGDPVPFLSYPPGLSLSGGLAQAGSVLALYAIFP